MPEPTKDPELKLYLVFVQNSPPLRLASSVDLIQSYLDQIIERSGVLRPLDTNRPGPEWWRPIVFHETADPDSAIIGVFACSAINGIIQGMVG